MLGAVKLVWWQTLAWPDPFPPSRLQGHEHLIRGPIRKRQSAASQGHRGRMDPATRIKAFHAQQC
eukprot:13578767-Alexandrium_andersonii.AAC.1